MRSHQRLLQGIMARLGLDYFACGRFVVAIIFAAITSAAAQAQSETFIIAGQVSFHSGRPAARVMVKLNTRAGQVREAFTNDQGRFEFTDVQVCVFTRGE